MKNQCLSNKVKTNFNNGPQAKRPDPVTVYTNLPKHDFVDVGFRLPPEIGQPIINDICSKLRSSRRYKN